MSDSNDLTQDRLLAPLPRDKKGLPVIGGVSLIVKIGSGGMGSVYKGSQRAGGRFVAVKILPFTLLEQNPGLEKRFHMEARTAAALNSPHVVQVFDVGCDRQTHFIVMEYVAGQSIGELLRKRRAAGVRGLPEAEVLPLAIAGARGLAAAHAKGIVHRDVKPDNFLVPDGHPEGTKLADLGLAKPEGGAQTFGTMSHVAMGTPGYMAPEQAEDAKTAGPAADVFSMGATIHAMLAGQAPFGGPSLIEILRTTASSNAPPLPEGVSPGLRWVVDRCLAKKAKDRFRDGSELLAALERVVEDPGATGPRPAKFARPAPTGSGSIEIASGVRAGSGRRPWIAAGVAVVLLAGLGGWFVLRGRSHKPDVAPGPAAAVNGRADEFLAQAARLEEENRLDDALATLAKAAAEAPDDPRIAPMRDRISRQIASTKSAEEKAATWRLYLAAADTARIAARSQDTVESWVRVEEAVGKLAPYAGTKEETEEAGVRARESVQMRRWAAAKAKKEGGDVEGALAEAREALAGGPANAELDLWVTKLDGERKLAAAKLERKNAYDDLARRAGAEPDGVKKRALWEEALRSADDPGDVAVARRALDGLVDQIEGADAARRFDAALQAVTAALEQARFDEAESLLAKAGEIRAGDPRIADMSRRIAAARSAAAYDAAMAEAEAAKKAGDTTKARAAYARALAARTGDKAATDALSALGPERGRIRPVAKGNLIDVPLGGDVTMRFVKMKVPGTTPLGEGAGIHQVTLTKPFAMGATEVTQEQWRVVMDSKPAAHPGDRLPVERITWWDAIRFAERLNDRLEGWTAWLPSEAQWEYACRAGTKGEWSFGDVKDIADYAWTGATAENRTHEVGTLKPNAWGLFDMHGNVSEWCYDGYSTLPDARELRDLVSPLDREGRRVVRGGNFVDPPHTRSQIRGARHNNDPTGELGVRLILVEGKVWNPHVPRMTLALDAAKKVTMEFALVRGTSFTMGDPREPGYAPRAVVITHDTWMQVTEVTQEQWTALMGKSTFLNPGPGLPAESVTWDQAAEFAKKLSSRLRINAGLPTEAEWELACRGDTTTFWYNGDTALSAGEIAWSNGNAKATQPAGRLRPNLFGIFDMAGNVYEWCQDWYAPYPPGDATNPAGPKDGLEKVMRGGCYTDNPEASCSGARKRFATSGRQGNMGFRVVVR